MHHSSAHTKTINASNIQNPFMISSNTIFLQTVTKLIIKNIYVHCMHTYVTCQVHTTVVHISISQAVMQLSQSEFQKH